jgi:hypothetical protein
VVGLVERAVTVEVLVLDDQRDVVDPVGAGQVEPGCVLVIEDEQTGQAAVDMLLGAAVRMRVVPKRGGRLVDHPRRRPGLARLDRLVRAAVCGGGQVHAMPVHAGGLRQGVADVDGDPVATGCP